MVKRKLRKKMQYSRGDRARQQPGAPGGAPSAGRHGNNAKKSRGVVILQITNDNEVVFVFNLAIFVVVGGLLVTETLSWNHQIRLSLTFFVGSSMAWIVYYFAKHSGLIGWAKVSKFVFDFFVKDTIRERTWRLTRYIPSIPVRVQKVGALCFKIVELRVISFIFLMLATGFLFGSF